MTSELSLLHSELALLPKAARTDLNFWRERLQPVLKLNKGITAALQSIAETSDTPFKTVERKFHLARRRGWIAIVDRRLAGPRFWKARNQVGITENDKELVKLYCGKNQRSSRSAVKQMRRDWQRGKIKTETSLDVRTGFPRGWSIDNLATYAPTKFELKAVRIGRTAAASERQLVYTTRKGLYVGSHYMLDDVEHDFFVNTFVERQAARPLELFSHDLFSARKVRFGIRPKTKNDDGTLNKLTERMTRMILAATLYLDGYSPRGTVIVAEHGTAAVRANIERDLIEMSDGKITVSRSGMTGAAAHAGVYAGPSKGNPRFKASLESSNNLKHNVTADFPGQTGKDVTHRPEQLHGLLQQNENLLMAHEALCANGDADRAAELQFALLELNQAHQLLIERYKQIEDDPDHDLEGWLDCGHVTQELLLAGQWIDQRMLLKDAAQSELALALISAGTLQTRPRKLTRAEVWLRGATELVRIPGHGVCAILGDDLATERRTTRSMFEFEDREVGPGVHRYEAVAMNQFGEQLRLSEGERYETFVNPFAPERLFVRRANGSYIGECRRIAKPCRGDVVAVQRACGAVAKVEAELLAPIRTRHLQEARDKTARHSRNVNVLRGKPVTLREKASAARLHEIQQTLTEGDVAAAIGAPAEASHERASVDEISQIFSADDSTD